MPEIKDLRRAIEVRDGIPCGQRRWKATETLAVVQAKMRQGGNTFTLSVGSDFVAIHN